MRNKRICVAAATVICVVPVYVSAAKIVPGIGWRDVFNTNSGLILVEQEIEDSCTFSRQGEFKRRESDGKVLLCDGHKWIIPDSVALQ